MGEGESQRQLGGKYQVIWFKCVQFEVPVRYSSGDDSWVYKLRELHHLGVNKGDQELGLTPVILATQEAEIRRIEVRSHPRQIVQ
jgi:hypothetical protein